MRSKDTIIRAIAVLALLQSVLGACPSPRDDWRCGKNFGNAPCESGFCCSEYGWCGDEPGHCNANQQIITCSEPTAAPTSTPVPTFAPTASPTSAPVSTTTAAPTASSSSCPPVRDDSRCGKDFGNAPCAAGECCSEYGWCDNSTDHCNDKQQIITCSTAVPFAATEFCGDGMLALTFDDGPNFATSAVLDILNEHKVTATLFVNGDNWNDGTSKCELLQRALQMGIEIASHSQTHASFPELNDQDMFAELELLEAFLKSCEIYSPVKFFRPPFGALTRAQAEKIHQNFGYVISFWNSKTDDGGVVDSSAAIASLQSMMPAASTGKGSLILLHDVAIQNSLDGVITHLKNAYPGYKFVTQQECWNACNSWQDGVQGMLCKDPFKTHYQLTSW